MFLVILESNSSMDISNEPSQRKNPLKRGRRKGLGYSTLPTSVPREIVLQFTHARHKKTTQCVDHGHKNIIDLDIITPYHIISLEFSRKQQAIIPSLFKLIVLNVINH